MNPVDAVGIIYTHFWLPFVSTLKGHVLIVIASFNSLPGHENQAPCNRRVVFSCFLKGRNGPHRDVNILETDSGFSICL